MEWSNLPSELKELVSNTNFNNATYTYFINNIIVSFCNVYCVLCVCCVCLCCVSMYVSVSPMTKSGCVDQCDV